MSKNMIIIESYCSIMWQRYINQFTMPPHPILKIGEIATAWAARNNDKASIYVAFSAGTGQLLAEGPGQQLDLLEWHILRLAISVRPPAMETLNILCSRIRVLGPQQDFLLHSCSLDNTDKNVIA